MNSFILIGFLAFCVGCPPVISNPINPSGDTIHNILTSTDHKGLNLPSTSASAWDVEVNLEAIGAVLQIKYNDPAHPLKGGRAHVKLPGMLLLAPFDDIELDIVFDGENISTGFFDMKFQYKLIQKSMILADQVQEGSFVIYRKLEGGLWKTRISVESNNMQPRPFIDLSLESDNENMLNGYVVYQDLRFDLKVLRVVGQSITVNFVDRGVEYTARAILDRAANKMNFEITGPELRYALDIELNPAGAWGLHVAGDIYGPLEVQFLMQKDLKSGRMIINYNSKSYVVIKVTGEAEMAEKNLPTNVNYVIKYSIGEGHTYQGKAKIIFNVDTTDKKLLVSLVPENHHSMDFNIELDTANPMKKYKMEIKKDGRQVQMVEGEVKLINDESQFDMESTFTLRQTMENPLYNVITTYLVGRPLLEAQSVRVIFVNKQETNILGMWNQIRIKDKFVCDGEAIYDFEYDTTVPKKMLKINFLPKNEALIWKLDSSAEYDANRGINVDFKFLHGDRLVHDEKRHLNIKVNDENKLEIESLETVVMTEESPLYGYHVTCCGRYYKDGERKMSVIVDKRNKSLKFIPKFMLKVETTLDSQKVTHIEIDITKPVRMIKLYYIPDTLTKEYNFNHTWEIEGDMEQSLIKQKMELQRGGVSTHMYQGDIKLINTADKMEVELVDSVVQTEESPFRWLFRALYGRYFKNGERRVSVIVNKRNKFIPKMVCKIEVTLDSEKVRHIELDTTKP